MQHDTLTPYTTHAFRDTLAERVETYLTHAAAWAAADAAADAADAAADADAARAARADRKRAGDARRRALATLARYATAVRATLGDEGASLSGGYRRALDDARAALAAYPDALATLAPLDVEGSRAWDPAGEARCPKCGDTLPVVEGFGARLDTLTVRTGDVAALRARWLADDDLAPRQRARIEGFQPYPHPSKEGHSYMLGPYRQSNCKPCRAAAARAAREV